MNWFSRLFATRRELKRLAVLYNRERDKVFLLERENKRLTNLLLEQNFSWADRFLTAIAKTYATGDEIKHNARTSAILAGQPTLSDIQTRDATLKEYLEEKRLDLIDQAREAGMPESDAEIAFAARREVFINEFDGSFI